MIHDLHPRWRSSSEAHIARHGVTWAEVVEAMTAPRVLISGRNPGTVRVLGRTDDGRYLAVVIAPDADAPTCYVVTAHDMTEADRRRYRLRAVKEQ